MNCRKCNKEIPAESVFCMYCGVNQTPPQHKPKKRGNGQGSVYKLPNGKYRAEVRTYQNGIKRTCTRSTFRTKTEALAFIETLKQKNIDSISFASAYNAMMETKTHLSADTLNCYRAGFKWLTPIHHVDLADLTVIQLQECMDQCDKGRRTKENIRTLVGLVYKWAIPRYNKIRNINLGEFLTIPEKSAESKKEAFTAEQLDAIKNRIGLTPYADYVYIQCYLGFRPQAFLQLTVADYNAVDFAFVGGIKTDAGKGRTVTISPKILPYVQKLIDEADNIVFCRKQGRYVGTAMDKKEYALKFYKVLEDAGIENPLDENGRHIYTPHTCRHTFATMLKRVQEVDGISIPDVDKLALIGHSDVEHLQYYQSVEINDLKRITDAL